MTDMTCRKTMVRCQTPGMCAPHGGCADPVPARGYLPDQTMAIVPFELLDKSVNGYEHEQGRARNELRDLLATNGTTAMGVGGGSGRLFIRGDYDSIKAMQAIVLERDALRAAPKYPINHGQNIIQFGDETFVWYDEAGLQGGVTYSLKSAEAALLRYVEQLSPAPRPDGRPTGCCCPPPGHTGIWGAGMCPVHQGLRRVQKTCIECGQPYCHGVCVEREDKDQPWL